MSTSIYRSLKYRLVSKCMHSILVPSCTGGIVSNYKSVSVQLILFGY